MSYSVSSAFKYNGALTNARWVRQLTIGDSDYSDRVIKWPRVERKWNEIKPGTVTIELTNEDRIFNFFIEDKTKLRSSCNIRLGINLPFDGTVPSIVNTNFVVPVGRIYNSEAASTQVYSGYTLSVSGTWVDTVTDVSTFEYITMFAGTVDVVRYRDSKASITFVDKFRQLADRVVGDQSTPVDYTSSSYLVHDMAWFLCTSHGGLSSVRSTSNPDIDYDSFLTWTGVFSSDNVRIKSRFTGQRPSELLKRISDITQSAIWIEGDKLKFVRFQLADEIDSTLDNDVVMDVDHVLDDRDMINKFYSGADYDVTSRYHKITVFDVNTTSVNSFGLREDNSFQDQMWFVDSVGALNLSQRMVATYGFINGRYNVKGPLAVAVISTIGDSVTFVDSFLAANDTYRVMRESIDLNTGIKEIDIDQTQYFNNFVLDVSELDGADVLG